MLVHGLTGLTGTGLADHHACSSPEFPRRIGRGHRAQRP